MRCVPTDQGTRAACTLCLQGVQFHISVIEPHTVTYDLKAPSTSNLSKPESTEDMDMDSAEEIVIVGGGICGLALALALHRLLAC